MKKKMQFMIPNAKQAFNIEHCLFAAKCKELNVTLLDPKPMV